MTELPRRAVGRAKAPPPEMQDFAGDEGQVVSVMPDERAAIERSLDAAARGDSATEAEVEAVWAV